MCIRWRQYKCVTPNVGELSIYNKSLAKLRSVQQILITTQLFAFQTFKKGTRIPAAVLLVEPKEPLTPYTTRVSKV